MRRILGPGLTGLGACLILLAVLLPTYIAGQVVKFPENEYTVSTLQATGASYFSASALKELTGVTIQATNTVKSENGKGNSSTAVWDQFTWVEDITNHVPVSGAASTRTFAFNRKTAKLVAFPGANVNGDKSIAQTGYVGDVFPMGTQKQTYDVFDTTLDKQVPFTYAGTGTVDGIATYKFTENYAPTQSGTTLFLGSAVGEPTATVTLPEFTEMHTTYNVDPVTGVVLSVQEHETTTVRDNHTGASVTVFDANLLTTPASVAATVKTDKRGRTQMSLIEVIVPIASGVVGAVALAGGLLASRRRAPAAPAQAESLQLAGSEAPSPEAGHQP